MLNAKTNPKPCDETTDKPVTTAAISKHPQPMAVAQNRRAFAQGCELYTCETLRGRGREMAASSDALKQMLSQGRVPTSSANVRQPRLPARPRAFRLQSTHLDS